MIDVNTSGTMIIFNNLINSCPIQGSAQIAVEIQHKDPFLADKGAIEHVLAVPDSVVPFDRANVPQQPRGPI